MMARFNAREWLELSNKKPRKLKRQPMLLYDGDIPVYGIIPLTHGMVAFVDPCDFAKVSRFNWSAEIGPCICYAICTVLLDGRYRLVRMHRFITEAPPDCDVDHKDGDGLNNRRNNLRSCTQGQNQANSRLPKNNTSGAKGVVWCKQTHSWKAQITSNYKVVNLGRYKDKTNAIKAYNKAALHFYGEFALTNPLHERSRDND